MSSRDQKVTCIWKSDEFIVFDNKTRPSNDEAYLIIDEPSEMIKVFIPSQFSIIQRRIIERRVQSIAKSGFMLPKRTIRIGAGFDITITKDNSIPDVLLQVGHHYQYGTTSIQIESIPTNEIPKVESSEQEYTPTFLSAEISGTGNETTDIPESTTDEINQYESQVSEIREEYKKTSDDENIAGRFIIALCRTGDIFISRKNEIFSIECPIGKVEFLVKNGEIVILSKKIITENDQILTQAIIEAKRL